MVTATLNSRLPCSRCAAPEGLPETRIEVFYTRLAERRIGCFQNKVSFCEWQIRRKAAGPRAAWCRGPRKNLAPRGGSRRSGAAWRAAALALARAPSLSLQNLREEGRLLIRARHCPCCPQVAQGRAWPWLRLRRGSLLDDGHLLGGHGLPRRLQECRAVVS